MHPADITAALKRLGYGQADVARLIGTARSNVSSVVSGRSRSRAVEEKISELTEIPLSELWPQWYGQPGGGVTVSGDGNRVVGRDFVGVAESQMRYGPSLSVAEERLLRLFRALEGRQQADVETYIRKLLAGGG